jgi:ribose transport system ATP-binding protein
MNGGALPVLSLQRISKSFGPVVAVRDVSIDIHANEVVGLVGENGAGKSTLMKIVSGLFPPDSGTILHHGRPLRLASPLDAARAGIGMVHQEQSLLPNISVAENIYLGREARFMRGGTIRWKAMRAAARRQLERVQLAIDPGRRTETLSFSERQMVELAKALTLEEETDGQIVVFLDEPTSVLEDAELRILFARVRALKSRAAFVFVSHRLEEVLDLSDRIYVMKDGEVVAEMPTAGATVERLYHLMVGQQAHAEYYREDRQRPYGTDVVLRAEGLVLPGQYRNIDFALHAGEVLGVAGVIGSGREALTRTLAGLAPHAQGRLTIGGAELRLRTPGQAVRCGIGFVPQERRVEGLVLPMSVAANMSLPSLSRFASGGVLRGARERQVAADWVRRLTIRTPRVETSCANLSGGNQQKVVLAKWIEAGMRVLILDHPTRGLDIGAKEDVYDLIRDVCADGVAVLLTADTLEETIGLSHSILVMRDGSITQRFDAPPGRKPSQLDLIRYMV